MLMVGKSAVIYGAAGSVGRAVARAFAREGAAVFLAGRTLASLEAVAEEIRQEASLRPQLSMPSTRPRSTGTPTPSSPAREAWTSRSTRSR